MALTQTEDGDVQSHSVLRRFRYQIAISERGLLILQEDRTVIRSLEIFRARPRRFRLAGPTGEAHLLPFLCQE